MSRATRSSVSTTARLAWIVDVQADFMVPPERGGRLYVHHLDAPDDVGAQRIIPVLAQAVEWLRRNARAVVYTGDWHTDDDAEIDREAPNFADTYPAHCMGAGSDPSERGGAALIPEVAPSGPMSILPRNATPADADAAAVACAAGQPVFIQKQLFSVFAGQPQTDRFLASLTTELGAQPEVVVCGVATNVCVRQAVEGFLDRGYAVTVIRDAIWGLAAGAETELLAGWRARGAAIITLAELQQGVIVQHESLR